MNTQELEKELIELAKQNPTEDYYVGSVGESLRDILKRFMGERYPEKEIDPPCHVERRPEGEIEGMLWDEGKKFEEYAVQRVLKGGKAWAKLLKAEEFPEGMGCITVQSLPQ